MIEGAVLGSLNEARQLGVPSGYEPLIPSELAFAAAAARNAADLLEALVRGHSA
jgi:hypothetical protein